MPKIKQVEVTYKRVLNLGNYSSATIGVSVLADVDEGEDSDAVITSVQETCREHARVEAMRLYQKPTPAVTVETNN